MRALAMLLAVTVGCYHGKVIVQIQDVARAAGELGATGRASIAARQQVSYFSWEGTKATIRTDMPVHVTLSDLPFDDLGNQVRGSNLVEQDTTFGALLTDCPRAPVDRNAETRRAYPNCPLLRTTTDSFQVGTRRFVPFELKAAAVLALVGTVPACAYYCDRPLSTVSTGVLIAGGVVAVAIGVIAITAVARSNQR